MRVPKIFKSRLFQCSLGVYALCLISLYTNFLSFISPVFASFVLEVNSFVVAYAAYVTYVKNKS
ncbi:MAG: hypothetical protein FWH28_07020 [Clostridiales bacterium]|nr:hypothetical protein [Clostridiales bacterium]